MRYTDFMSGLRVVMVEIMTGQSIKVVIVLEKFGNAGNETFLAQSQAL